MNKFKCVNKWNICLYVLLNVAALLTTHFSYAESLEVITTESSETVTPTTESESAPKTPSTTELKSNEYYKVYYTVNTHYQLDPTYLAKCDNEKGNNGVTLHLMGKKVVHLSINELMLCENNISESEWVENHEDDKCIPVSMELKSKLINESKIEKQGTSTVFHFYHYPYTSCDKAEDQHKISLFQIENPNFNLKTEKLNLKFTTPNIELNSTLDKLVSQE